MNTATIEVAFLNQPPNKKTEAGVCDRFHVADAQARQHDDAALGAHLGG